MAYLIRGTDQDGGSSPAPSLAGRTRRTAPTRRHQAPAQPPATSEDFDLGDSGEAVIRQAKEILASPFPWEADPTVPQVAIAVVESRNFERTEMRVMGCGAAPAVSPDGTVPSPPQRGCAVHVTVERPGLRGYGPDLWIDDATTSILLEPPSDLHVMTASELDGLADLVEALDTMCRLTGCSPEVVEKAQHRYEESAAAAAKAR